jgi:hypothetical protein
MFNKRGYCVDFRNLYLRQMRLKVNSSRKHEASGPTRRNLGQSDFWGARNAMIVRAQGFDEAEALCHSGLNSGQSLGAVSLFTDGPERGHG